MTVTITVDEYNNTVLVQGDGDTGPPGGVDCLIDWAGFYGAVGDGVTDDSDALQNAIDNKGLVILFSGKTYAIGKHLKIHESDQSINIQSRSILKRLSSFADNEMIYVEKTGGEANGSVLRNFIDGNGTIDCSLDTASGAGIDYGIRVVRARFGAVSNLKIIGAKINPVLVGDSATYDSTDFHCRNVESWFHEVQTGTPVTNAASSIGIYYKKCTDSFLDNCHAIGYRKGFKHDGGSIFYNQCHTWTRNIYQGLMSHGFYINGGSSNLVACYADTPNNDTGECYGFFINSYNTRIIGGNVYNNPSAGGTNNLLYGVYFNIPASQTNIFGLRCSSGNASYKFKAIYNTAQATECTILGINDDAMVIDTNSRVNILGDRIINSSVAIKNYEDFSLDSVGVDNKNLAYMVNGNNRFNLRVTNDTESGSNAGSNFSVISYTDAGALLQTPFKIIRSSGRVDIGDAAATSTTNVRFNTLSSTTVGAAGAASALPANPVGYITININGTDRKIPYYNT